MQLKGFQLLKPEDLWEFRKQDPTISFLLKGIHMYDTGMILDKLGIAVRTGTHCAQLLWTGLVLREL